MQQHPEDAQQHLTASNCGHYGIFSGRRWREFVYPQLRDFIRRYDSSTRIKAVA